ncbi:MAG: hypothetical protein Q4B17_09525 [Lautropia sp.]|nr:hypothetical protein [Lautropia sp.]
MDKDQLLSVAKETVHRFWRDNPDLQTKAGSWGLPHTVEHGVPGADDYSQMEIDVFHDDEACRHVRVSGLIDDGRGLAGEYSLIVNMKGGWFPRVGVSGNGLGSSEQGSFWGGMQFVFAVIEIFLPELMSALSGPASIPLANRFRRVGHGLIGLACLFIVLRLGWWLLVGREAGRQADGLLAYELAIVVVLIVMGLAALSLSRRAFQPGPNHSAQAQGTNLSGESMSSEEVGERDAWIQGLVARHELRLSRSFSSSSPSLYRRLSRVSWLRLASALKGRVPLEVWQIEVEGIPLEFSFHADAECFRLKEQDGVVDVRATIIPGERAAMRVRLLDQAGSVRELHLLPQPSLRYPLLVFVDAVPITFQR